MEHADLSGTVLGQYQVMEPLGTGGMAQVYKAVHPRLKRTVALKVILPDAAARPDFRERFDREAQTIARLQHPHIVAIYDYGEANGLLYLVMQYVGGGPLNRLLKRGQPLAIPQAVQYTVQMARAWRWGSNGTKIRCTWLRPGRIRSHKSRTNPPRPRKYLLSLASSPGKWALSPILVPLLPRRQ